MFMVTTLNNWWQTFHAISCLHLTSTYWIIHLTHCLHVKQKFSFKLVKETLIMMNTWISINSSICNARLFLGMMNISASLVCGVRSLLHLDETHWWNTFQNAWDIIQTNLRCQKYWMILGAGYSKRNNILFTTQLTQSVGSWIMHILSNHF